MGNFSYWIEKLQDHYQRKTGMRLYPGTLNIELEEAYSLPKRVVRLEASEYGGTVSVNMVPCVRGARFCCARMRMKRNAGIIRRQLWRLPRT
jgi:hypothetical protein